MGNLSYCRFQNTARDLRDCADHIGDALEGDEARGRAHLAQVCLEILLDLGLAVDGDDPEGDIRDALAKLTVEFDEDRG